MQVAGITVIAHDLLIFSPSGCPEQQSLGRDNLGSATVSDQLVVASSVSPSVCPEQQSLGQLLMAATVFQGQFLAIADHLDHYTCCGHHLV